MESNYSDVPVLFYGTCIFLFLLISAFFSAAETALTALSRARIYQMVKEGNKRAALVSRLRKEKESLIGAVLLGNNAVNIAASALATTLSIQLFGGEESLLWVTLIMTLLVVIFSEILPKTYAIQNAERVSFILAPALQVIVKILYPITQAIQYFIYYALKLVGIDITKSNTLISAVDVIRGTIELHHREGKMVKQDRDMLGSILDLNDILVAEVMVHRTQVDMIDVGEAPEKIVEIAVGMLHSRIPLWKDNPDNIVGVLHVKDLIKTLNENGGKIDTLTIRRIAHEPWFIPETTTLRDQLVAFRHRRQHFAVVVDEYGAYLGIVTLEDIIEEIVGDIDDEHDVDDSADIQKLGPNTYLVTGSMTIRDINRQLDWSLPDEDAATIAGLVMHLAQMIPAKGQAVSHGSYRFTVSEKRAHRITRLKIEKLNNKPSAEEEALREGGE